MQKNIFQTENFNNHNDLKMLSFYNSTLPLECRIILQKTLLVPQASRLILFLKLFANTLIKTPEPVTLQN